MENQLNQQPLIDFYQLLNIDKNADEEIIKKAYRKMALKYHPDKAGNSPEAVEKFQSISKAYNILSDPKKRKIYDRYGSRGIDMIEQMGEVAPFIDPDMVLAMNWIFFLATIIISLLIIFSAFLSVKADDLVKWTWPIVFIPAFILDGMLLIGLFKLPDQPISPENEQEELEQLQNLTEEERRKKEKSKRQHAKRKIRRFFSIYLGKLLRSSYVLAFIAFQIFLALKLQNSISWTWGIIFIPWFILEGFHFFIRLFGVLLAIQTGKVSALDPKQTPSPSSGHQDEEENREEINYTLRPLHTTEKLSMFWRGFFPWVLRVIQVVFIILKLEGILGQRPWKLIFVPFYLIGCLKFLDVAYDWYTTNHHKKKNTTDYQQLKAEASVGLRVGIFITCAFFFYLLLGLLIQRLDSVSGPYPSTAIILIPVFIILSLLFCCFCCCLPCISSMTRRTMEEELKRPPTGSNPSISPDKQIVWISASPPRGSLESMVEMQLQQDQANVPKK